MIALWESVFTVSEYIVRPDYRGKGIGSSALAELLMESELILDAEIAEVHAVIYPNNVPSQKAFEKAGFQFESEHLDGDAWNYRYQKK